MKDSAFNFVEAAANKIHYTLGLISGFGVIYEGVKQLFSQRPHATFWHYVLAVDWFIGVAVVYTFIAFIIGCAIALVMSAIVGGAKDDPKRKQFANYAAKSVVMIAPIIGIVIGVIYRSGPVLYSSGDIPGIILFRLVGLAAIALAFLLLFGGYQQALHRNSAAK